MKFGSEVRLFAVLRHFRGVWNACEQCNCSLHGFNANVFFPVFLVAVRMTKSGFSSSSFLIFTTFYSAGPATALTCG